MIIAFLWQLLPGRLVEWDGGLAVLVALAAAYTVTPLFCRGDCEKAGTLRDL